ncbi:MAG: hypothetical protein ACREJ2_16220 [Planctomycetota bacterium]
MGVPMRMRCDNCGYDFVGQLEYSDKRKSDVIRCKACEYEVPALSDEEISTIEKMLNKERNWAIYAMVAWAAFFVAVVVLGVSYFWQVGAGLGGPKDAKNEEILWSEKTHASLYMSTNVSTTSKLSIPDEVLLMRDAGDPSDSSKVDDYNKRLKKIYNELAFVGDSIDQNLTRNAKFKPDGSVDTPSTFDQEYGQYVSDTPVAPPGDWEHQEDSAKKLTIFRSKGEDIHGIQSVQPGKDPVDMPMKLFVTIESRVVDQNSDEKPQSLGGAELDFTDGDITVAIDPFTQKVIRTEIKRPTSAGGFTPDAAVANAVVFGPAIVTASTVNFAGLKPAKDTSPTSIELLMLFLAFVTFAVAMFCTWLGNKGRYTMQLGFVDKEAEAAQESEPDIGDEDADLEGGDLADGEPPMSDPDGGDHVATARMDDDLEIS